MFRLRAFKEFLLLLVLAGLVGFATNSVAQEDRQVVTSIKPLHSIVSAVMSGVGEPELIIPGFQSPHTHILRPSNMRTLQNAKVVFLIDESCEASMGAATRSLDENVKVIQLMKADDIELVRWADDSHRGSHDDNEEEPEVETHRDLSMFDHHIWLDPLNAIVMAREVARVLSEHFEEHAEDFSKNADNFISDVEDLIERLTESYDAATVSLKPFIVYHDGYQSFEHRFGLDGLTRSFLKGEYTPGAKHIQDLQKQITDLKIECVFTEPQFDDDFVDALEDRANLRVRVLDPLGATLDAGPDLYVDLLENLSTSIIDCLTSEDDS
ncbi:MAG: hypothetical protein F4X56_09375 [Gammaproteobacteria bacterium]|nr:hypothetical protein [Gammaproteobacteria bacterium]MYC26113.1 hypothetical protein [Gammaproteobacteria bacterium]